MECERFSTFLCVSLYAGHSLWSERIILIIVEFCIVGTSIGD